MMSQRYWLVAALFTLASSGMAQGTMKHNIKTVLVTDRMHAQHAKSSP